MKQSAPRDDEKQTKHNSSKSVSRLSRGPINPLHKIFVRNDKLIRRELNRLIARRRFSMKVSEICAKAAISTPTFYLHYRNCDDAMNKYEQTLMRDFVKIINYCEGKVPHKKIAIGILLNFVAKHRRYFMANCKNNNLYLLNKLLDEMREVLVGKEICNRTFIAYRGTVGALIVDWVVETKTDKAMIDAYVEYISRSVR